VAASGATRPIGKRPCTTRAYRRLARPWEPTDGRAGRPPRHALSLAAPAPRLLHVAPMRARRLSPPLAEAGGRRTPDLQARRPRERPRQRDQPQDAWATDAHPGLRPWPRPAGPRAGRAAAAVGRRPQQGADGRGPRRHGQRRHRRDPVPVLRRRPVGRGGPGQGRGPRRRRPGRRAAGGSRAAGRGQPPPGRRAPGHGSRARRPPGPRRPPSRFQLSGWRSAEAANHSGVGEAVILAWLRDVSAYLELPGCRPAVQEVVRSALLADPAWCWSATARRDGLRRAPGRDESAPGPACSLPSGPPDWTRSPTDAAQELSQAELAVGQRVRRQGLGGAAHRCPGEWAARPARHGGTLLRALHRALSRPPWSPRPRRRPDAGGGPGASR
jgi:hypothetical protein